MFVGGSHVAALPLLCLLAGLTVPAVREPDAVLVCLGTGLNLECGEAVAGTMGSCLRASAACEKKKNMTTQGKGVQKYRVRM